MSQEVRKRLVGGLYPQYTPFITWYCTPLILTMDPNKPTINIPVPSRRWGINLSLFGIFTQLWIKSHFAFTLTLNSSSDGQFHLRLWEGSSKPAPPQWFSHAFVQANKDSSWRGRSTVAFARHLPIARFLWKRSNGGQKKSNSLIYWVHWPVVPDVPMCIVLMQRCTKSWGCLFSQFHTTSKIAAAVHLLQGPGWSLQCHSPRTCGSSCLAQK